jgi:hypothetical protein
MLSIPVGAKLSVVKSWEKAYKHELGKKAIIPNLVSLSFYRDMLQLSRSSNWWRYWSKLQSIIRLWYGVQGLRCRYRSRRSTAHWCLTQVKSRRLIWNLFCGFQKFQEQMPHLVKYQPRPSPRFNFDWLLSSSDVFPTFSLHLHASNDDADVSSTLHVAGSSSFRFAFSNSLAVRLSHVARVKTP